MAEGRRVVIGVRVSESLAAAIDGVRGGVSRSSWLEALARRELPGAGGTVPDVGPPAPAVRARRPAAAVAFREPAGAVPAGRPRGSSGACKHPRVLKGWCKDCMTGGHF